MVDLTVYMDAIELGGHEPRKGASHLLLCHSWAADPQVPGLITS